MINLDLEPTMIFSIYQTLIKKDIQVSSAIANPNVAGLTGLQLSWIWTTHQGIGEVGLTNNHLTECMSLHCIFSNATDVHKVYQVHWLQAWATFHRWEEELALTQNEMHWVINYFTFWQKQ